MRTFLTLFLVLASFNAFAASTLTEKTAISLKLNFGIELTSVNSISSWSEAEGKALLQVMHSLPTPLQAQVKQLAFPFFKVSKYQAVFSPDPEDYRIKNENHQIRIPLYQHQELKQGQYSKREQEVLTLLQRYNLVATQPDLASADQDAWKKYLSYLQREFLRQIFYLVDLQSKYSERQEWRSLSGWQFARLGGITLPFWQKDAENQDFRSYAHPVGVLSPRLDFATVAADFFAPPTTLYRDSIKCRMPKKFDFLKKLFPDHQPHLENPEFSKRQIGCPDIGKDFFYPLQFNDIHTGEPIDIGPITADTVTGFELIYATPGDREISEIAGHLLLRMKVDNNPQAKALGQENPYDITLAILADNNEHKLVLGMPQSVITKSDVQVCKQQVVEEQAPDLSELVEGTLQALQGLSGQFRTLIQVDTLQFSRHYYTVKNNRSLERFRLILTEEQKKRFIEFFYRVAKGYKTDYYFFNINCGSILVKLIGEALNEEELSEYNLLVAPPNSLITALLSRGIIEPVYPTFYSYTARAQIAQDLIRDRLKQLKWLYPQESWPDENSLFNTDEKIRTKAYQSLRPIAYQQQGTLPLITEILNLAQKAELNFTWNQGVCIGYSTMAKTEARGLLKELRQFEGGKINLDLESTLRNRDIATEKRAGQQGTNHTRLMSWSIGAGNINFDEEKKVRTLDIEASIYRQSMGDRSNRAMQRGTAVELGKFSASWNTSLEEKYELTDWHVTGLRIRKIKARRHRIPSVFSQDRKFGMGFTLLDISRDLHQDGFFQTTFAEGEVFTSLISSRHNLDYINIGIGLGIESPWSRDASIQQRFMNASGWLTLPIRLEGLITIGHNRKLQVRAGIESKEYYDIKTRKGFGHTHQKIGAWLNFSYDFGDYLQSNLWLTGSIAMYHHSQPSTLIHQKITRSKLGLEIARW